MTNDPLVVALATAMEGLLTRGLEVRPCGDGWTIKLVQDQNCKADPDPQREQRRSW